MLHRPQMQWNQNGWNKIRHNILDGHEGFQQWQEETEMKCIQTTETIRNSKNNQRRDTKQDKKLWRKTKETVLVWRKIIETIMKTTWAKKKLAEHSMLLQCSAMKFRCTSWDLDSEKQKNNDVGESCSTLLGEEDTSVLKRYLNSVVLSKWKRNNIPFKE